LATSTLGVQPFLSLLASQIPTSGFRSRVPPNHAATISCDVVSTIVDACADGYGALS
jgi:hypothetical protein